MDLVRHFYRALNRSALDDLAALYHPACIVEHVWVDGDRVHEGRDEVRRQWAAEFERYAGALAGGRRIEVPRIAGMETGWGGVRANWRSVLRGADGRDREMTGYSDFWVEDGLIRRHRSIRHRGKIDTAVSEGAGPGATGQVESGRRYPSRPIVGVGAVVFTEEGLVVLVKRRQEPLAGQWSLPGGTLEVGETLEAGAAREILEETGLVVDVGPVIEVFDRILLDEVGRVRHHFVLVDYLCQPREGRLVAGTDVAEVALVDPEALGPYRVAEKAQAVIRRALEMRTALGIGAKGRDDE
jgi:ADP-ribose pyrophosphatase YjhB (NUDIX family)/ketosteroid isomerase-like protein